MLKKLYRALVIAFIGFSIVGWSYNSNWLGSWLGQWLGGRDSSLYSQLPSSLTFFKSYQNTDNLIGDYSVGSPTATFTRATDSTHPATYVDANGVIQLVTTADVPRFAGGYYDATGFHSAKGLYMEAAGTNLLIRTDGTASGSGLWTGWSATNYQSITGTPVPTNNLIPELSGISGATSQRYQYTGIATDTNKTGYISATMTGAASVAENNVCTFSVYVKAPTTNTYADTNLIIDWRDSSNNAVGTATQTNIFNNLTTSWRKFSVTGTAPALTDRVLIYILMTGIDNGENVDIEIACPQLEKNPYPTSFIPTTTDALTRNAEVLKYAIAGNRTAAEETIAIKFMPLGGSFANDGIARGLSSTDTKLRLLRKNTDETACRAYANVTDNGAVGKASSTINLVNTSYVFSSVFQHSSPYINVYINGSSEGTYTAGDFTDPAWGTNFEIGSYSALNQLNGLIQSIAIFGRALSSGEVLSVYNTMR